MPSKPIKQFEILKHRRQMLVILIFLFVAIIFWIIVSITGSQKKVAVSKELRDLAKPLVPSVDEGALDRISQKKLYSEEELENFAIYKLFLPEGEQIPKIVEIAYEEPEEEALTEEDEGNEAIDAELVVEAETINENEESTE